MTRSSTDAVHDLFVAHATDIFVYAARRVGRDLAHDLTAETFRQAIESWPRFDPDRGSARGWLFGIATNLLRRHWRTERRRLDALDRTARRDADSRGHDEEGAVDARLDAQRQARSVVRAVMGLPEPDRELLILLAWEGLSHSEIAAALDIPAGTVRSRLHRIRRGLDEARSGHSATEPTGGER